jgi:hypothetical protein
MDLLPEGSRFAVLRHMFASPTHLIVMAVLMIIVMTAVMMMLR